MRSPERRILLCWLAALLSAAAAIAMSAWIGYRLMIEYGPGSLELYLLNACGQIGLMALPALLILAARPERWQRFCSSLKPLTLPVIGYECLLAVGGAVTAAVISSLWSQWLQSATGYSAASSALPTASSLGEGMLCLLAIAIAPALCEELLFRTLLQGSLCRRLPRAGVWIAALLFAAAHRQWGAFPALLLIGAVLGKVYLRHGYWAGALLHALYNAVVLVLSGREIAVTLPMIILCAAACWLTLRGLLKEEYDEADGAGL